MKPRVKLRASGKPQTVLKPEVCWVNAPMYWMARREMSRPAVIGRSNRYGSVNASW
jgi:hypothetical protein